MTVLDTQFSTVDEVTYGTAVTTTRFFETEGVPDIHVDHQRAESAAKRSGTRVMRADRFAPYKTGAGGSVTMPVLTKGFGWWLKHMLGTVATSAPTDSNYTHSGTVGSLLGDFFTAQVGRVFHPAGTVQAFTFEGCKVASWELSLDVDGLLMVTFDIDAEDESTAIATASPSYPSGALVFSFAEAAVTFAAGAIELKDIKIACDNKLNTNRRFIRGSSLKKEPTEAAQREITWEATAEFSDLTQYNRYRAALASDTYCAIVATFTGPIAHAGTTLPTLVVTIPASRFDKPDMSDDEGMVQSMGGKALYDGTNSPITVAYKTSDATP